MKDDPSHRWTGRLALAVVSVNFAVPIAICFTFAFGSGESDAAWYRIASTSGITDAVSLNNGETVHEVALDPTISSLLGRDSVFLSVDAVGGVKCFSSACPHCGATLVLIDGGDRFLCPAHAITFDRSGGSLTPITDAAIEEYSTEVRGDGEVWIDIRHEN